MTFYQLRFEGENGFTTYIREQDVLAFESDDECGFTVCVRIYFRNGKKTCKIKDCWFDICEDIETVLATKRMTLKR